MQLKLHIREQSRELTAPYFCEEDAIEQGQFLQQSLLTVATNAKEQLLGLCKPTEAEPSQQAQVWLIPERWGAAHKIFCLLQWPGPVPYSVSLSSNLNPAY